VPDRPDLPVSDDMLSPEDFKVFHVSFTRYQRAVLDLDVMVRGVRYHLYLQQTTTPDASSAENVALLPLVPFVFQKRADRVDIPPLQWFDLEGQLITNARQFFGAHYPLWVVSAGGMSAAGLDNTARDEGYFNGFPCRRQLMTVRGNVTVVDPLYHCLLRSARQLLYTIPGLPVVHKERIIVFQERRLCKSIFRVSLDGTVLAMKTVYQYSREREAEFVQEACVLAALPPHPHVVGFHGLVAARHGRVDALLLDFIDGHPLRHQKHATPAQQRRWKEQLRSGLAHLHVQQPPVIWVDAKVDNVMITTAGDAVLCDFGGGYSGLVDKHLSGTVAGDQQGMTIVFGFIDELPSPEPSPADAANAGGDRDGHMDGGGRPVQEGDG